MRSSSSGKMICSVATIAIIVEAHILLAVAGFGLVACNYEGNDPKVQIGPDPKLPELQQYLIPPMQIARVVGWGKETPTVPQGLQVYALASGFEHPRSLYVLPNGDVLVD